MISLVVGEEPFDRRRHPPGASRLAAATTRDPMRNDGGKRAAQRAGASAGPREL